MGNTRTFLLAAAVAGALLSCHRDLASGRRFECTGPADTSCGSGLACVHAPPGSQYPWVCGAAPEANDAPSTDPRTPDVPEAVHPDVHGEPDTARSLDGENTPDSSTPAGQCKPCSDFESCDPPLECLHLGAGRACLKPCVATADCPGSHVCYPATSSGKSCLPVSYSCPECAWKGCPPGKCCDYVAGQCTECRPNCASCSYDFECRSGSRCNKQPGKWTGACAPECPVGECGAGFSCAPNSDGVRVCTSAEGRCPSCLDPSRPYGTGSGDCVECLDSGDCAGPSDVCAGNACVPTSLEKEPRDPGFCLAAGLDCAKAPHRPACCSVGGVPSCCQCAQEADCDALYERCSCRNGSCFDEFTGESCGGTACLATCSNDADCEEGKKCWTGRCYQPPGLCDPAGTACCAPNEGCFDLMTLLFGPAGAPWKASHVPGTPYCSCTTAADCRDGLPCTVMSSLCNVYPLADLVCPGGSLPSAVPPRMCFDPARLR